MNGFSRTRLVLCALVVVVFCRYLLYHLPNYGLHDWDQHLFYYGSFFKSLVEYHQFPFWNPWYCGGNVLWQNPQIPIVSPVYVLSLLMPLHMAMKLNIIIHYFIALLGMIFVGQKIFKIQSFFLCLVGSSLFVFNGFFALQITEGHTWIFSFAYIPYAFYFFHRSLVAHKIRDIVASAMILALMIFSSGIYPLFYMLIFFGIYFIVMLCKQPSWNLLKTSLLIGALAFGFSSIKLIPVMAFAKKYPRVSSHQERHLLTEIPHILFYRYQSVKWKLASQNWRWHEYGCFLGIGLSILLLLSFFYCFRRPTSLSILSALGVIIFLLLFLGRFSDYAPYAFFDIMPVARSLRVPGRALILWTFCASLCSFHLLKFFERFLAERHKLFRPLLIVVLLVSFGDLVYVNSSIFSHAFEISPGNVESLSTKSKKDSFRVVKWLESYGSVSAMYKGLLRNVSTLKCYEPQKPQKGYRMDRPLVFAERDGIVYNIRFSPQKITFYAQARKDTQIYLNQNYVDGWRVNIQGSPVVEKNNLPMISLQKGFYRNLAFRFVPQYWNLSVGLFLLTWLSVLILFFRQRA